MLKDSSSAIPQADRRAVFSGSAGKGTPVGLPAKALHKLLCLLGCHIFRIHNFITNKSLA